MDDGVAAEFILRGTHEGELRGMPPTGKSFECRMVALFLFEPDSDRIVCERVYFDSATILAQLTRNSICPGRLAARAPSTRPPGRWESEHARLQDARRSVDVGSTST